MQEVFEIDFDYSFKSILPAYSICINYGNILDNRYVPCTYVGDIIPKYSQILVTLFLQKKIMLAGVRHRLPDKVVKKCFL